LALARDKAAGASSTSDGFVMGGSIQNGSPPGFYTQTNNIQKFPFAIAGGTGTDVADLVTSPSTGMREASATQSAAEVFVVGARVPTANTSNIYKFPFAISSGTVSPIANIGYYAGLCHVFSTSDHGFFQPVTSPNPAYPPNYPIIKFPFAISGSGELTEVGQATPATRGFGGTENQSIDNAFIVGASNQGTQIRKFPFAISSGFSVDTGGDLVTGTSDMMGTSSVTHGYCLGGWSPPANAINVIQKYPFSIGSGGIGSDVGDLVTAIGDGPSGGIQT
jgi:hypothetical protein